MSKKATRTLIQEIEYEGEEGYREELLELIRRGNKHFGQFLEKLSPSLPANAELRTRSEDAVKASQARFLETGLAYLQTGPELDFLLQLMDERVLADACAHYLTGEEYLKVFTLSGWLLEKNLCDTLWQEVFLFYADSVIALLESADRAKILESVDWDKLQDVLKVLADAADSDTVMLDAGRCLSNLYLKRGKHREFAVYAIGHFTRWPLDAEGELGFQLVSLLISGSISGAPLPLPSPGVIEALRKHMNDLVKKQMKEQSDSVAKVMDDIIKHADSVQEWNEWGLSEYGYSAEFIAGKIYEEAASAHRKSVALTRYLQTFEEPELVPTDIYPVGLELVSFGLDSDDFDLEFGLIKGLPEVPCDERLLKIALSEFFAFLTSESGGLVKVYLGSRLAENGGIELVLSAKPTGGGSDKFCGTFDASVTKGTMIRVVRAHGGTITYGGGDEGSFAVSIILPAHVPDKEDTGKTGAGEWWEDGLVSKAKDFEADLSKEVCQILSFIVHDVKNAFSFIQSWTEGLRNGGKEANQAVVRIRENIERVRVAAKDADTILSLNSEPKVAYEDIARLVEGVLVSVQASFELKRVGLYREYQRGLARLPVDRARIESLVANLVKNALEATLPGGYVRVTVGADEARGLLLISVTDTGESVTGDVTAAGEGAPQNQNTVGGGRKKGTGVGLLAARKIAQSHSGDLTLSPGVEGGLTACFSMPLSTEEQFLAQEMPLFPGLCDEAKKALRAAVHFDGAGDAQMTAFLWRKAVEAEARKRMGAVAVKHRLASACIEWVEKAGNGKTIPRELKSRLESIAEGEGLDEAETTSLLKGVSTMLREVMRNTWKFDAGNLPGIAAFLACFCLDSQPRRDKGDTCGEPLIRAGGIRPNELKKLIGYLLRCGDAKKEPAQAAISLLAKLELA